MIKLRYSIYPFLHFLAIIHGLQEVGQNSTEIFFGKEGVANIQGHILSSGHHKNWNPRPSYMLMCVRIIICNLFTLDKFILHIHSHC